jgi:hypothetical protein
MPRRLFTTYAVLPRGDSGAPPPPPPPSPPPHDPAPSQGDEEKDSDNEEFLPQLPTDTEVEEAAAEQRAILASFETQRRDQSAQELMAAEMRAAVARLAEEHAAARADAHRRTYKRQGPRWRQLSNASPRRTWPKAWRWWRRSASDASISTLSRPSMQRPSDRGAPHLHLPPRGRRAPPSRACVGGEPPPRDGFPPPVR